MAYSSVPTYTVGQILTAANLNTYLRDNMAYLKGQAGTVAIENGATFAGSVKAKVAASNSVQWVGRLTNPDQTDAGGSFAALGFEVEPNGFAASGIGHERRAGFGRGRLHLFSKLSNTAADPTTSEIAMTIDGTNQNYVGFGTQTPQGRVHALDTSGRGIVFVSGVVTTSATTIISGLSISAGAAFIGSIRTASNGWFTTSGGIASGSSNYIWNNGGTPNALTMSVTSSSVSMTSGGSSPVTLTVIGWLYYF